MKKSDYFLVFFYSLLIVSLICHTIFNFVGYSWQQILLQFDRLQSFVFILVGLTLALTFLVIVVIKLTQFSTVHAVQKKVKGILNDGKRTAIAPKDLDRSLDLLDDQLHRLAENLQKTENRVMRNEEEIVEGERKRIARDLHDTVSQELFAANMILSGVSAQAPKMQLEDVVQQLNGVTEILNTAQNDLRILLLHLRPTELEGKTLVEGMHVIFRELKEKSNLEVHFQYEVRELPSRIEEHLFRIVQEIVSNTLKHARAHFLDVYLFQEEHQLQLRMIDDGVGFDPESLKNLSYGLKNIKDRVEDMAGTIKFITSPKKGVTIDIRVPLL